MFSEAGTTAMLTSTSVGPTLGTTVSVGPTLTHCRAATHATMLLYCILVHLLVGPTLYKYSVGPTLAHSVGVTLATMQKILNSCTSMEPTQCPVYVLSQLTTTQRNSGRKQRKNCVPCERPRVEVE